MIKNTITFFTKEHFFIVGFSVFIFFSISESKASNISGSVDKGKAIFEQICSRCHTVGGGEMVGPDLLGVTERREREWLVHWISNPGKMIQSGDPIATELLKEYELQMPKYGLSEQNISDVLSYIGSQIVKELEAELVPLKTEKKGNEVDFTSKTYLQFFEDARGNKFLPFYEHIEMELRHKKRKWSIYSSGWLRYNIKSPGFEKREIHELSYAFLRYSPYEDRRLLFNVGRHLVFEGVASEQIDGISARMEITPHTGFLLFGGKPVEKDSDGKRRDLIYGGRIFQRFEKKAEIGVSFLSNKPRNREESGVDLWLLPIKNVEFQGHSFYNNITGGWIEHSYNLRLFSLNRLILTGLFVHTNYNDAFSTATLNAFLTKFLRQNEELTKLGGSIEYKLNRSDKIIFNFIEYEYDNTGNAEYYGMTVIAEIFGISTGASLHRMEGDNEMLRYTESRAYAKKKFYKASISIDAINLHYDTPFNGLSNAYVVNGTVDYKINDHLFTGFSVDYGKNPDFTHYSKVLLKLFYTMRRR